MKNSELSRKLKISSLALVAILLQSCSTLEIAHAKLDCLPYPEKSLADRLSDEELDSFSEPVWLKTTEHIVSYQERINSICDLIDKHNKAHK